MERRDFLQWLGLGSALAIVPPQFLPGQKQSRPPNIVFILADDLGWPGVGYNGNPFYETPNIDRLAIEGMKFTNAYAAGPVCSPTRASIMTGKYPARLHITDFIAGGDFPHAKYKQPDWQKFLPLEETTIAEALKPAGYVTALFGKWHLSVQYDQPESLPYNPDKQGFDQILITNKPNQKTNPEPDAHNVDRITERAVQFLQENMDRPFFLFVAHNTVHDPVMEKAARIQKYKAKSGSDLPQNNPILGAMMETLDNSVGRLMKKLDALNLTDHTIVVFYSDNGGLEKTAKQTPLRSGKANLYEGGIREPLVVRWPGVVEPGSICSEPVTSPDFFPTFLEIAGIRSTVKNLDGMSLMPLLAGSGSVNREALYWHYPHYHSAGIGPCGAVRKGNWKLIEWYDLTSSGSGKQYELFDLGKDLGEQENLTEKNPRKTAEMVRLLSRWRERVGAQMLELNPNYNPENPRGK